MIRSLKDKWSGISDEGLAEAVADCLQQGVGLKTSEFTVDDVRLDGSEKQTYVSSSDPN